MFVKILKTISAILGGCLLGFAFLWTAAGGTAASAASAEPADALIAVQFEPGDQLVRVISFTAPISGLAALQLTGLQVETVDFGGGSYGVCSIEGVGCPADDCFCEFPHFWNYETWNGSAWQGYPVGASESSIQDGAIEGWRWAEIGVGSLPAAPQLIAAHKALSWLSVEQSAIDGGYGSNSSSVESLLSIGSNGLSAFDWRLSPTSPSLMEYFLVKAGDYSQTGASASGKLAAGLSASGACLPYRTKLPLDYYDPATGGFDIGAGFQSWAMLGTAALSQTIPVSATSYLKGMQQPDGGWEWFPGGFGNGTDTNTTALALQALLAAGLDPASQTIISATQYLKSSQNDDGGFPYDPDSPWGTDSDANSSAYAVQAIYALGQDPAAAWTINTTNPISYLLGLQLVDGSIEFMPGTGLKLFSTQQAIPALLGRSFPLKQRDVQDCPAAFLPLVQR